jgi:hypothetical protein
METYIPSFVYRNKRKTHHFVHPAEQVTDPHVTMQFSIDYKAAFLLWLENHIA